jgi:hypothetical protein
LGHFIGLVSGDVVSFSAHLSFISVILFILLSFIYTITRDS